MATVLRWPPAAEGVVEPVVGRVEGQQGRRAPAGAVQAHGQGAAAAATRVPPGSFPSAGAAAAVGVGAAAVARVPAERSPDSVDAGGGGVLAAAAVAALAGRDLGGGVSAYSGKERNTDHQWQIGKNDFFLTRPPC